jgi:hypothetical protein
MTYSVTRYTPSDSSEWDTHIRKSRNGTFLLERGFVDYHGDRFRDHSLIIRDTHSRILAVLPAHEEGAILHSHRGLTYGGFIYAPRCGAQDALAILSRVRDYLADAGFSRLTYKTVPWIYHRQPSEDDRYALFRVAAKLVRRDVLAVLPQSNRIPFQNRRLRGLRNAQRAQIRVAESADFRGFWSILSETLACRHGASPAHSAAEIEHLKARFPLSIRLHVALEAEAVVAGVVIFLTEKVAHAQYIAASPRGRELSALDLLFDHLINVTYQTTAFFDFGISNEGDGRILNRGLLEYKEGFGARAVVHDHYEMDIDRMKSQLS